MARSVVDIALIELNGKELYSVVSMDIQMTDPGAEPVVTMRRRRRAIGYKSGVPTFEIDVEAKLMSPPEVDWNGLWRSGKLSLIAYEENEDGERYHLVDCRVTEVSKSFNADGEATQKIKILALDHVKEA